MLRRSPGGTRARGFTLIEVLVALVVMAVGMLGIASLYLYGLREGRSAVYRTAAVTLASDMADRIRANPAGTYDGAGPGADNSCVNGGVDCAPEELAADDWARWLADLDERMPQDSTATIEADLSAPPIVEYRITITWPEPGQAAPPSYSLAMQL
ncbi:MAG: type IV pilus modification protein PilV [Gammaproteobacteria bacterium]|nr:type IV pilus modification protein PilV [Gammaproteobacteria bacterium]